MAKRILVPLDEAVQAETVIEAVAALARGAGATIRLLHVAPPPDNVLDEERRILAYADQEGERLEIEALDYLRRASAVIGDVAVECARFGNPVREILEDAEAWQADLIAMATRGRGSLSRVLLGSVAEHVFRRSTAPVMLVRAAHERPA
jgi:nucleotide-binding universal stress UspA family protein